MFIYVWYMCMCTAYVYLLLIFTLIRQCQKDMRHNVKIIIKLKKHNAIAQFRIFILFVFFSFFLFLFIFFFLQLWLANRKKFKVHFTKVK